MKTRTDSAAVFVHPPTGIKVLVIGITERITFRTADGEERTVITKVEFETAAGQELYADHPVERLADMTAATLFTDNNVLKIVRSK